MPAAANHPAGLTGLLTTVVIIIAGKLGVELTAEEGAIFVGALVSIVSLFTPRVVEVIAPEQPPEQSLDEDPEDPDDPQ